MCHLRLGCSAFFLKILFILIKWDTQNRKTDQKFSQKASEIHQTCSYHVARGVHFANEKLQADDGVDDDDEEYQQRDVKQGNHGFNNGV